MSDDYNMQISPVQDTVAEAKVSSKKRDHKRSGAQSKGDSKKRKTDAKRSTAKSKPSATKQSEFLCHVKYRARLPEPPVEVRLLANANDRDALVRFAPTSLDTKFKWDLMQFEPETLLAAVDFVDPQALGPRAGTDLRAVVSAEDEKLISTATAALIGGSGAASGIDTLRPVNAAEANLAKRRSLYGTQTSMLRSTVIPAGAIDTTVRAAEAKRKLDAEQVELELMRAQGTPEGEIVVINEMFDESAAMQSAFDGDSDAAPWFRHPQHPEWKPESCVPILPAAFDQSGARGDYYTLVVDTTVSESTRDGSHRADYLSAAKQALPVPPQLLCVQSIGAAAHADVTVYQQQRGNHFSWSSEMSCTALPVQAGSELFFRVAAHGTSHACFYDSVAQRLNASQRIAERDTQLGKELRHRAAGVEVDFGSAERTAAVSAPETPDGLFEAIFDTSARTQKRSTSKASAQRDLTAETTFADDQPNEEDMAFIDRDEEEMF